MLKARQQILYKMHMYQSSLGCKLYTMLLYLKKTPVENKRFMDFGGFSGVNYLKPNRC